jgi:hypothetical protein
MIRYLLSTCAVMAAVPLRPVPVYAMAFTATEPFGAVVVSHEYENGAAVSLNFMTPSIQNSTRVAFVLAVTATVTVPVNGTPGAAVGLVKDTVIAPMSPAQAAATRAIAMIRMVPLMRNALHLRLLLCNGHSSPGGCQVFSSFRSGVGAGAWRKIAGEALPDRYRVKRLIGVARSI